MTTVIVCALIALVAFTAGWVFRDAKARGLPTRKAATWAALQGVEWPLFFWFYRRARPKTTRSR